MKITFPHMGMVYMALKSIFDDLNVEYIVPQTNSKKTLDIGTKYSPKQICTPFIYNMGNYIQAIEKGADTIVIVGGNGTCRFGYYSDIAKQILNDLGYQIDFIVLDQKYTQMSDLFNNLKKMMGTNNPLKVYYYIREAYRMIKKLDIFDTYLIKNRCYEKNKGEMDLIYFELIENIRIQKGSENTIKILNEHIKNLKKVKLDNTRNALRIGLVGEIYSVIDDCCNLNICKKLNELGCEVYKTQSVYNWLKNSIFHVSMGKSSDEYLYKKAYDYVKIDIGGHGRENIGHIIDFSEKNFDGVIHTMPFSCMPEIIARQILPKVLKEHNIPVMSLILDEMTGETGYNTRLEAFIEMLNIRREKYRDE